MATLPRAVRPSAPGAAVLAAQPPGRTAPERGPVRLPGPDRSAATGPRSAVRSWPLLVLAAPAAAEVWSGWVGIAARTGFGLISPLPGIWPSLHIDTTITLPVGVEAYAAYALRAWLAPAGAVSQRTRRFARQSAIFSFALGGAGQVAYHLLEQAQPGMHALPRHPGPGRDLRHRNPGFDLEDSAIPLLDNRHLHQRQSRAPVTRRPQTTRNRKSRIPAPVNHVMGLRCQASTGTGHACLVPRCRVEPYWIKAAPLRSAAARRRAGLCLGGPPGERRAALAQNP